MNCSKIQASLSAFIDGELDPSSATAIKAHLIRCETCRAERERLDRIGVALRSIPQVTAPEDFEYRVYAAIHNKQRNVQVRRGFSWKLVLAPMAAMVIGVFIGSFWLGRPGSSPAVSTTITAHANVQPVAMQTTDPAVSQTNSSDENQFSTYAVESYFPPLASPVTVDSIPEDTPEPGTTNLKRSTTRRHNTPRYVLDQVPVRVSYERTIY